MQKWFVILVIAVAALAVVAGCADTPAEQPSTPSPTPTLKPTAVPHTTMPAITTIAPSPTLTVSEPTVLISGDALSPAELTVKVGSQVRWVNGDDHPHRVKFSSDALSAFLLSSSQSFSQQFDHPGVYDYTCAMVPSMRGKITVVA